MFTVNEGGCSAPRADSSPVTVSGFDCCAIKDEEDEQQTEAALHIGALVLEGSHQHAGHCRLC